MGLIDLIEKNHGVISVVGMAKNAGKTVTLNRLIDEAMERNISIGITSTGRDGESHDLVTDSKKPLIYVDRGTLIATAEDTLRFAEARLELLEVTNIYSALGRIIIAKAVTSGYVQIAGPATNRDIKEISKKILSYGASLVIIDGAIDRISAASPSVTDATILATGAVLSRDMDQVIERTLHQIKLFSLPAVEDIELRGMIENILLEKRYCIIDINNEIRELKIATALRGGEAVAEALNEKSLYVVIGGSLVSGTIKTIMEYSPLYKNVIFVVKDATKIFIPPRDWIYFTKSGIRVNVIEKINPLAVTINPYAPQGYYFNPEEFLLKARKYLHPVPVFDLMMGGGH